jgi:hypothetical protein
MEESIFLDIITIQWNKNFKDNNLKYPKSEYILELFKRKLVNFRNNKVKT